jgi:hypothetical protein
MTQPIWRLMSMGYQHQQAATETENVLSIGVGNDIMRGIEHLMSGGLVDMATWKISSVFHAFNQFKLESLSFDGILPLNLLGTISPPSPHLGVIKRQGRNNSMWLQI